MLHGFNTRLPGNLLMPSNTKFNSDNTYSFVIGRECILPFKRTASSFISDVGIFTPSERFGVENLHGMSCGALVRAKGFIIGKAMYLNLSIVPLPGTKYPQVSVT